MNNFTSDLFDQQMGPKQSLPRRVRVDLGVIAAHFTVPKSPDHVQNIFWGHIQYILSLTDWDFFLEIVIDK